MHRAVYRNFAKGEGGIWGMDKREGGTLGGGGGGVRMTQEGVNAPSPLNYGPA